MARVTVEDCIEKVPNRFDLVLLAAHRSRMIREGSPITVDRDNDKDPVVSLREIADESVDLKVVKEALISGLQEIRPGEENEREADRVALQAAPAATEEDVMRAYQAELESGRDDRLGLYAVREVAAGLCVGTGLMVNNTDGQLQGLFVRGGEFVRTPKLTAVHEDPSLGALGADRAYASPLHWTFFLEIAVMAYSIWGAALLVRAGEPLWSIAMVFWAVCMALTIQQQVVVRTA